MPCRRLATLVFLSLVVVFTSAASAAPVWKPHTTTPIDLDADAVADAGDNCPGVANPDQADADGDGLGDACEPVSPPAPADGDGDGVPDASDNCPETENPGQADSDGDGAGDACDAPPPLPDGDGDGVPDASDNCPETVNPGQADRDGDGAGDLCDGPVPDPTPPAGAPAAGGADNPQGTASGAPKTRPAEIKQPDAPPDVDAASVRAGDHSVTLRWKPSAAPDFKEYVVTRSTTTPALQAVGEKVVYRGTRTSLTDRRLKNGVLYRYVIAVYDVAGNRSAGIAVLAVPRAILLARPKNGAHVRAPVRLVWVPVRGAAYFNVQLYRERGRGAQAVKAARKVLTTWTSQAYFTIPTRWAYRGRFYRLAPGRYRWYVWPGLGKRADARYGPLLGQSTFVVEP
jgi:hypothetical protein